MVWAEDQRVLFVAGVNFLYKVYFCCGGGGVPLPAQVRQLGSDGIGGISRHSVTAQLLTKGGCYSTSYVLRIRGMCETSRTCYGMRCVHLLTVLQLFVNIKEVHSK